MFVSFTASHCSSRTYSFPLSNTESTKSQPSHVQPAFALQAHSSIADTLWVSIHQSISDLPLLDHLAIERWHINLTSCSSSARGHRRRLGNQIQPSPYTADEKTNIWRKHQQRVHEFYHGGRLPLGFNQASSIRCPRLGSSMGAE